MATRIRLTPERIRTAQAIEGKQTILRDAEQPGLGLRITPAGAKAFIYQGKLAGDVVRMTLGDTKTLTLSEARDKAATLRKELREGRDPRIIKKERTAADVAARAKLKNDAAPALEAWAAYIENRAPRWSERHCSDHKEMSREGGAPITRGRRPGMSDRAEPGILRPLLELPLNEITRDRVTLWRDDEAPRRPTRTRLALSVLAAFINWCAERPDYRDQINADACTRLKRDLPKPQAKDDCLQSEQLAAWFDAVRKTPNPTLAAYLQIMLLTGARREEIARLRWADVDLDPGSMQISDTVEGTRTIPITPYVKSLLLEQKRRNTAPVVNMKGTAIRPPSPFVFPSTTAAAGYLVEPRIGHNKALEVAGLPHMTIHGLRRSFGTLAEWVEVPDGIVKQIMGHKPSGIAEKHYRRRPIDLLRKWHSKIEGFILEQAGIAQPKADSGKVIIAAV